MGCGPSAIPESLSGGVTDAVTSITQVMGTIIPYHKVSMFMTFLPSPRLKTKITRTKVCQICDDRSRHIDNDSGGNACDKTDDDNQDLAASGSNIGASVTENVNGGIAEVQNSVTQVLNIRSIMRLMKVLLMTTSEIF